MFSHTSIYYFFSPLKFHKKIIKLQSQKFLKRSARKKTPSCKEIRKKLNKKCLKVNLNLIGAIYLHITKINDGKEANTKNQGQQFFADL